MKNKSRRIVSIAKKTNDTSFEINSEILVTERRAAERSFEAHSDNDLSFVQAFECIFTSKGSSMSIFVNASSFQEAASKIERLQPNRSIHGNLTSIRNIGIAVP